MECRTCRDSRWVCDEHRTHPSAVAYDGPEACDAGPGTTCPSCNPLGLFPGLPDDAEILGGDLPTLADEARLRDIE